MNVNLNTKEMIMSSYRKKSNYRLAANECLTKKERMDLRDDEIDQSNLIEGLKRSLQDVENVFLPVNKVSRIAKIRCASPSQCAPLPRCASAVFGPPRVIYIISDDEVHEVGTNGFHDDDQVDAEVDEFAYHDIDVDEINI
jgi:hypothetical protein